MADKSELDKLLTAGINAAKNGDKATARDLLQQVIEQEQYNEQAWFWLASVVETDEERRTCLGNVVLINPANKKAQELLDQLEAKATGGTTSSMSEVVIPGLDRRTSMIAVAVGAALILGLCTIFAVLSIGGGDKDKGTDTVAETTATDAATRTPTSTLDPEVMALTPPTNTAVVRATLPPVATNTPTQPPRESLSTLPPPPDDLTGRLIISSGDEFGNKNYQPLFVYDLSTRSQSAATENQSRGWVASASRTSSRYVFEQFNTGQREVTIQIANLNGTNSRNINEYWNSNPIIFFPAQPAWSPTGDSVVFVGKGSGGMIQNDLYLIPVSTIPSATTFNELGTPLPASEPSRLLRQLTNDPVDEQWPSWSRDGRFIVYVADMTQAGTNGTDLRIMDVQTGGIQFLTNDTISLTEVSPNWGGPNGQYIIYSASAAGSSDSDIWIVSATAVSSVFNPPDVEDTETDTEDETAPSEDETPTLEPSTETQTEGPRLLIDFGPQDIRPIWSPDGRFIAFASNWGGGEFDVYIYNFETGEIFAVTQNTRRVDVPHDWIP